MLAADVVVDKVDQPARELAELVRGAQHELLHVEDGVGHAEQDRVEDLGHVRRHRAHVELVLRRHKVQRQLRDVRGLEHAHAHREVHGGHDGRDRGADERGDVLELAELGDKVGRERLDVDGRRAGAALRQLEDVDVEFHKAKPPRARVHQHKLDGLLGEAADHAERVLVVKRRADALAHRAVFGRVAAAADLVVGALRAAHVVAHAVHLDDAPRAQLRVRAHDPVALVVLGALDALLLEPRGLVANVAPDARQAVKGEAVAQVRRGRHVQHARAAAALGRARGAGAQHHWLPVVRHGARLGEERRDPAEGDADRHVGVQWRGQAVVVK